jgi:heme A synthase
MEFKGIGALGGLCLFAFVGGVGWKIGDKIEPRHFTTLIVTTGVVIVICFAIAAVLLVTLAYRKYREQEVKRMPQQRGWSAGYRPSRPPAGYLAPASDGMQFEQYEDQGSFVLNDQNGGAW